MYIQLRRRWDQGDDQWWRGQHGQTMCCNNTHSYLQTLQSHEGVALSHAFGGVCQMEITENGMKTALLPNK